MAHDKNMPPESNSRLQTEECEFNLGFGRPVEEKPIWAGLYENLRDLLFPQKLPPLELSSKPIPVPDRMAVKANPWAIGTAAVVNGSILAVVLFFGARKIISTVTKPQLTSTNIELKDLTTYKAPKAAIAAGGGGGGGDRSAIDALKGHLPKIEKNPILAPQAQTVEHPKLAIEPAIDVQKNITLADNPLLPNIGVKSSSNVRLASNGTGSGGGMGSGSGGGLGSGSGNGYGAGSGGNTGGGVYRVGGDVSNPVLVRSVEAEFSEEARRAKYQGAVTVSFIIDAQGNVHNPRVVRALGMGLDEQAIKAIMQYKFKPAIKNGKAVSVYFSVAIDFHIY